MMSLRKRLLKTCLIAWVGLCCVVAWSVTSLASDVVVGLSSREAYVGSPLVMEIQVINGESSESPKVPEVPGLDIQLMGQPMESTQTTIINGRYSQTSSLTYRYRLVPRHEGRFEIPAFQVDAGDQVHDVRPLSFVATRSETGDLLFAEVVGDTTEAYVGEPVELKLKIWIKPFVDREAGIAFSEGAMWQCLSEATSWGAFKDRMQNLAANGQRPGGEEVLRKDGNGDARSYFLYEIGATVYPDRPGKLALNDVQIVVDYPVEVRSGRSMDPFDPFGGMSFGPRRPRVTRFRPVTAEVPLADTEILPLPTEGQPAGFRGAVGVYQIRVTALENDVEVGQAIPLVVEVAGTGPMDLLQPPALEQVPELSRDFRIPSAPLVGTVAGTVKRFETTIRARNDQVRQIPAIGLSFFDPEKRQYETVYSEPIPIHVRPAKALALDDIVAAPSREAELPATPEPQVLLPSLWSLWGDQQAAWTNGFWGTQADLSNPLAGQDHLATPSGNPAGWNLWTIGLLTAPPLLWGLVFWWKRERHSGIRHASGLRGKPRLAWLEQSQSGVELGNALATLIVQQCRVPSVSDSVDVPVRAVASLRLLGNYPLAAGVERFLEQCSEGHNDVGLADLRTEAVTLYGEVMRAVRAAKPARFSVKTSASTLARGASVGMGVIAMMAASVVLGTTQQANAMLTPTLSKTSLDDAQANPMLSMEQTDVDALLSEANQWFQSAQQLDDQQAEQRQKQFEMAARRYQQLVDTGKSTAQLYLAMGNAWAKAQQWGPAIAAYRQGLDRWPDDGRLQANLSWVRQQVAADSAYQQPASGWGRGWLGWSTGRWRFVAWMGWLGIWGVLIVRQMGTGFGWTWLILPCVILVAGVAGLWLPGDAEPEAVVLSPTLELRQSDGESYPVVGKWNQTSGWEMSVMDRRPGWVKLAYGPQVSGWIAEKDVWLGP